MANLIEQTSRKSDWAIQEEERVRKARAGHASFTRSFADLAETEVITGPRAVAFISGIGGSSNAPTVERQRTATKADVLSALPVNAKRAAERFDDGTQAFLANVYARHKADGKAVTFTATDAGKVMGKDAEAARKAVEALASAGLIRPSYNSMGGLAGYVPGSLD